jgi:MFS family permease
MVRMFGFGLLSIVLVLHLAAIGLDGPTIGLMLSLTLLGDVVLSLILTTRADRIGRRRTLLAGAALVLLAGAVFALTDHVAFLLIGAILGVISPTGHEAGPFLPVEQVSMAQLVDSRSRTSAFAAYNLGGSLATAAGSLAAGLLMETFRTGGSSGSAGTRGVIWVYTAVAAVLMVMLSRLSGAIETTRAPSTRAGLFHVDRSRSIVFRLAGLFAVDSFAGGFIAQSIVAWWFHRRFGVAPAALGAIFFGANVLAGLSALAAARIAARFGLLRTMVFTHLPSNLILLLVPFMPTAELAVALLLVRYSISQMDVPTRQSYVIAVVDSHERSAAAGITGVARTVGAAFAPMAAVPLIAGTATHWMPFVIAGTLKIGYDLALLAGFRGVVPEEERR